MAFDREELLEKLAMALVANPGSTMKELADSAGISKASLHRIYSTKEKLQTIIIERMQGVFAEIRQSIQKPHEDYMEALRELIHIHCRNSTYILFIGRDDFFDMLKDEEWDDYYNDLEAFFREGQEQGLLTLDFSAGVMGDIFISLVTGLLECHSEALVFIIPRLYFSLHPSPVINGTGLAMDSIMLAVLLAALADVMGIFYWLYRKQRTRILREGRE